MFHPITTTDGKERLPTVAEALAQLAAQSRAKTLLKEQAQSRAADRRAKLPPEPINAPQKILDTMQGLSPRMVRELKHQADHRQKQIDTEKAVAAERERIENDPAVKIARENAGYLLKAAGEEFMAEATEAAAIAAEGDVQLYWTKARELEQRIYAREDAAAQEKLASRGLAATEFSAAAQRAVESEKRLAEADAQANQ